jgi:integrase
MRIEGAYTQYLVRERRLSRTTVHNYLWVVREFLSERYRSRQICLAELNSDAVTSFVLRYAANGSTAGTAQFVATGLRSFLRFLQIRGKIKRDLAACVPKVPSWRDTNVPVSLTAAEVRRVIGHCDRHTSAGQRDGAILMLLARLGLRAAEVGGLLLDDIHWAEGEITIRGKGGRRHRFPLPQDVGEALTLYLRSSRPRCQSRWVFVRLRAPFRPFAHPSAAIGSIVARALERGDLHPPQRGAHLLRHTAATRMLRRGASLAEIGEVLRHRSPMTTTIYAKVDLKALRSVAAPWPQVR